VATPSEFDDLFDASSLQYDPGKGPLSDGFLPGAGTLLSTGGNYNTEIITKLGSTAAIGDHTCIWTDPDGDTTETSTLDYVFFSVAAATAQFSGSPSNASIGWLLVSESTTTVDPEPLRLKVDAIDALDALLTGDKKTDKRLEHAIEHLIKSVEPDLWEDDSHLTDKGKKVFSEEKKAVKHLMDEQKHKKSVFADPELQAVIDTLVEADRQLAMTAVDEAMDAEGDCKKILDANKEFIKALHELAKGKFDKAIKHYGHAWEKAEKSLL